MQGRLWGTGRRARSVERVVEELGADVVALQEAHPPAGQAATWEDSRGLRYDVVYGPTLTKGRGPFGNALLSRHPVREVRRIDLSVTRREPRGALDVSIDVGGATLRVVATHLGLRARERLIQVEWLLEVCGPPTGALFVFMGDINEWRRRGPVLSRLEEQLGPGPRLPTFPSRWPIMALDRIWARPRSALVSTAVHRTQAAVRASDHLPVVARLVR